MGRHPCYQRGRRHQSPVLERPGDRAQGTGRAAGLALRYTGRAVSITALGEDGAALVTESISAEVTGAEEFEVSLSPLHLASLLNGISGRVVIGLAGSLPDSPRPLMINGTGTCPFRAMLAPIRKAAAPAEPRR